MGRRALFKMKRLHVSDSNAQRLLITLCQRAASSKVVSRKRLLQAFLDTSAKIPGLGEAVTLPAAMLDPTKNNQEMKGELREMKRDALEGNPFSTRIGDAVGFAAGLGGAAWKVGAKAAAPITGALSQKLPQLAPQLDRALRYGGRGLGLMAAGGAEAAGIWRAY